jgi:hypothetical protein
LDKGKAIVVERRFPNLTPVRHKKEGYAGWIDGVTKIEGLFTGNKNMAWQYRVYLSDGKRKVAPEEDIEHTADLKGLPPEELRSRYVESFEGESDLHALGYNLSDMNQEERQKLLVFCALPMLGPERVIKSLCDILWRKVRRNKTEKIEKYHNAIEQWSRDLDFVLKHDSVDVNSLNQDIRNYVSAVQQHLEKYVYVEGEFLLNSALDHDTKDDEKKAGQ